MTKRSFSLSAADETPHQASKELSRKAGAGFRQKTRQPNKSSACSRFCESGTGPSISAAALQEALACLLRNRAAAGLAHRRATGRAHPLFGGGGLAEAARGLALCLLDDAPELAAALKTERTWLGSACAGGDPTGGALFVHPHWKSPAWARRLKATALIGPYLFLTLPFSSTEKEFPHGRADHGP